MRLVNIIYKNIGNIRGRVAIIRTEEVFETLMSELSLSTPVWIGAKSNTGKNHSSSFDSKEWDWVEGNDFIESMKNTYIPDIVEINYGDKECITFMKNKNGFLLCKSAMPLNCFFLCVR